MAPNNPSVQTEVENLDLSISAIDNQISKLYNDFQASKKTLLKAAESSDLIHDYNEMFAQVDRLRSDIKYKDREIAHLQTELATYTKKVTKLESELAEKNELLSRIGAFANNKSDDSPFPSKRAPSPSAESGDHRRKFGRYDNAHTHKSTPNQHQASYGSAHPGQHRQANYPSSHDRSDNSKSDARSRSMSISITTASASHQREEERSYSVGRTSYASSKWSFSAGQPKPDLDELRRHTFNPPVTRKVEDYLADGRGETSDHGRDLNIPNGAQGKKPFRPRVRRLVCHHCWQQRLKCDNGFTCQQCEVAGTKCVRTLCKWYHTPEGCNRPIGYCFKIHGEKGYETTDFDPFAKNPPPPPPPPEE